MDFYKREAKPIQDSGNIELRDTGLHLFTYCCMFVVGCIHLSMGFQYLYVVHECGRFDGAVCNLTCACAVCKVLAVHLVLLAWTTTNSQM